MDNKTYLENALKTENTPSFIRLPNSNPEMTAEGHAQREKQFARLVHGLIGVTTEMGESWDAVKKALIYGKPLDTTNIVEEVGDKLWYLALLLSAVDSDFGTAMMANIEKLTARYGNKFTSKAALNRNLNLERSILENNINVLGGK